MKDLSWRHVTIVVAFFGTVAALTLTDHDTGAFIAVGMGILAGMGLLAVQAAKTTEQTTAVKEQTNGLNSAILRENSKTNARILELLDRQSALLAAMQPAAPSSPPPPSQPPLIIDEEIHQNEPNP